MNYFKKYETWMTENYYTQDSFVYLCIIFLLLFSVIFVIGVYTNYNDTRYTLKRILDRSLLISFFSSLALCFTIVITPIIIPIAIIASPFFIVIGFLDKLIKHLDKKRMSKLKG